MHEAQQKESANLQKESANLKTGDSPSKHIPMRTSPVLASPSTGTEKV